MARIPVILHERLGHWIRQLRPRLCEHPVRWFESRSPEDLDVLLTGLAFPVLLLDLRQHAASGLKDLAPIVLRVPNARTLVLDPDTEPGVAELARELGATYVFSGFVPPPVVAELLARWIALAVRGIELAGWSRTTLPESDTDPWSWLSDYLDEPRGREARPAATHSWSPRHLPGAPPHRTAPKTNREWPPPSTNPCSLSKVKETD